MAAGGGQDAPAWGQGPSLNAKNALKKPASPLFLASARLSIQTGQRRSARGPVQGERGSWQGAGHEAINSEFLVRGKTKFGVNFGL